MRNKHLRRLALVLLPVPALCLPVATRGQPDNLKYVNPFIGTSVSDAPTKWGNEGGCFPGAAAVSGYFQLTPETRHAAISGYDYRDSTILVFSCLYHSSGFPGGSAGALYLMPVNGDTAFVPLVSRRPFHHHEENASPGYYRVRLTDDGTEVETSAGTRTGMFRMRFPEGTVPKIFIGNAGNISRTGNGTLSGGRFNLIAQCSRDFTVEEAEDGGKLLVFNHRKDSVTEITIRLAASEAGLAAAAANLDGEIPPAVSFDSLRRRTAQTWLQALSVAEINDPDSAQKIIFFTALYHSLLVPWIVSDVNGNYRGADGRLHQVRGRNEYGKFSPWDTYRTLNPLRALLYPEIEKAVAISMFDVYAQTGRLPTESMTGNHAIAILADDYRKGLLPVDKDSLFRALQSNVSDSPFVQRDMPAYLRNGYLDMAWPESVTRTVEYGYDDWVLAEYARTVMHDEGAAEKYAARSRAYRKLFDPVSHLLLPATANGFLAHAGTTGYKEGDAWVYTFNVPQDTRGLSNLMGGDSIFVRTLNRALEDGSIYFDNETAFHIPWLFNEAGAPERTQYWVRYLRSRRFKNTPGGIPGNDDLGSTSSWFVLSALGFYPLTPGRSLYAIGSPLFREVRVHLAGGKTLEIKSNPPDTRVTHAALNHQPYLPLTVTHEMLAAGGEWEFDPASEAKSGPGSPFDALKKTSADIYPFSETKTGSDIRISEVMLSKSSVLPDESFRIKFTAVNKGAAGSIVLSALDGDSVIGTTRMLLDSGESKPGELSCRAYVPGIRTLSVGKKRLSLTVISPAKGSREDYRIANAQVKPLVRLGDWQHFSFDVQNRGGRRRRFEVPVSLNGKTGHRLVVSLNPGEHRIMTDSVMAASTGKNRLQIGRTAYAFQVYRLAGASLLVNLKWDAAAGKISGGALPDRSGFGNDGLLFLNPAAAPDSTEDGVPVGNGSYIALASAPVLDHLDSNLTVMAWIRPGTNAAGLADIIAKGDHHVLQLTGHDQISFFAGGWGRGDCTVSLPADWVGHWRHVAGVCRGRILKLYLDGQEAGTTVTDEAVNLSNENHWNIGRNEEFPGIRMFSGLVNAIKIFADALPEDQVRSEMNRDQPRR